MKKIDTGYYQSKDGQNVKRILVDSYLALIDEILKRDDFQTIIQMGYGDGDVVLHIKDRVKTVIVLEGDRLLCEQARKIHCNDRNVSVIHTLFERYSPSELNANLVLGNHVLEHVDNPVEVIKSTRRWLKKGGEAFFSVPNATSLHRRIGVQMGLLKSIYDLNEQDKRVGHQRNYNLQAFLSDLEKGGYKIKQLGGFNLKLVSQKQMQDWPDDLLRAIFRVSLQCPPDFCSNIYAICQN